MVLVGASDECERVLADSQFGSGATTYSPATWYIGLSLTLPNPDGTGFTEPVGNGYLRKAVTSNATNWPAATTTSGVTTKTNGALITFANPTGAWGPIVAWGAFVASSGGIPRFFNKLESTVHPTSTAIPVEFDVGFLALIFKGEA